MLWINPAIFIVVHKLMLSSASASSVPRQTGMPASRILRNGMTPLPSRRLQTGLCAMTDPASAIVEISASSSQIP